jgi:hypothetical protein
LFWWNSKETTSSIDHCWIHALRVTLFEGLAIVEEIFIIKSPRSNGGLVVSWVGLESLNARLSIHNLRGVISAKQRVWLIVLVTTRHAKGDDGLLDDSILGKGPDVILFPVDNALLWC